MVSKKFVQRFTAATAIAASLVVYATVSFARPKRALELQPHERLITILATNDIHGGIEPVQKKGKTVGGMVLWGGVVNSIRKGLKSQYGTRVGTLLVDAGDQFQGTLVSNYNEGRLLYSIFKRMGYDAVVPGNHGYDFGPTGWLDDRVNANNPDKNPRGAIMRLARQVKDQFPLLGANVYFKRSLKDKWGNPVKVGLAGEVGHFNEKDIVWSRASRPGFMKPYLIKKVAGVRVALIGMEHPATPRMTTRENVDDLYFRSEVDEYLEVRARLESRADVFVLLIHKGNASNEFQATELARKLTQLGKLWSKTAEKHDLPGKRSTKNVVDLVVAAHTHYINNALVNGVPIVQSGSGGTRFGRIDLVWDTEQSQVVDSKTRRFAGVSLKHGECASNARTFCKESRGKLKYEGVLVKDRFKIEALISEEREQIAALADRELGFAEREIIRNRIYESGLANALTDGLRELSGSDISFINTGGMRANIDPGVVTYEDLFRVFPFSNRAVVVGPMKVSTLIKLIQRSIKTCGAYSSLMQSGLRVVFERNCQNVSNGRDENARLLSVKLLDGKVIYDERQAPAINGFEELKVSTIDYLYDGGSGYLDFAATPLLKDLGILREALAQQFINNKVRFTGRLDGRWLALTPQEHVH